MLSGIMSLFSLYVPPCSSPPPFFIFPPPYPLLSSPPLVETLRTNYRRHMSPQYRFARYPADFADNQLKGMIAKFVNFMGLTSTSPTHQLNGTDFSPGIYRYLLYPLDPRKGNMDNQANRLVNDVSPFPFSQSSI